MHCAIGECPTLRRQLKDGQALVDVRGRADELRAALTSECERQNGLTASLIVFCTDRRGMLVDVATVVTGACDNIINVHADIFTPQGDAAFKYEVTVRSRAQLEELMQALASVPDVTKVEPQGFKAVRKFRIATLCFMLLASYLPHALCADWFNV